MESIDKATPRPWHLGVGIDYGTVWDQEGHAVASCNRLRSDNGHADAALIAEAVNSYDQLRSENAVLRKALEYIFDHDDDCECECNDENCCIKQPSLGGVGSVFCPRCIVRAALEVKNWLRTNG